MKKIGWIFIVGLFLFFQEGYALSISEMSILNLDKIKEVEKPKGYTSVQGGTTTDKYVITLFIKDGEVEKNTAILVLDKETYEPVELEQNPITDYNFAHANDATYNSKTNELLVLAGRKIFFLDLEEDHFTLKKTKKLKYYYHGLGYDEENNQYVLARSVENETIFEIVDENFKIVNTFSLKTNLTRQSLTVYKGNIYYVCYEAGRVTKHETIYDGILKRKENLIYIYDLEGKRKNVYYIPYSYKELIFGEIENISFNQDKMLIQFNHIGKSGYFTPEYRKEIFTKINVDVEEKESSNIYSLLEEKEEIQKVKSKDNQITYHLRYYKEGTYEYQIKDDKEIVKEEVEEDDNLLEEPVEEKNKNLIVKVFYDPLVNRLKVETNEKDLIFKEGRLEGKEEKIEPLIVEVPDTKTNSYWEILGLLILVESGVYLRKQRPE